MHQIAIGRARAACALLLPFLAGGAIQAQGENQYIQLRNAGSFSVMRSGAGSGGVCTRLDRLAFDALRASARADAKAGLPAASIRYTAVGGDIIVNFTGFTAEAQAAFEFAADILASQLNLDIPIIIDAAFEPMDEGVLGSAGFDTLIVLINPTIGTVGAPPALADQLLGSDTLGPEDADIVAAFSSTEPDFYFGTDSNPAPNQIDFVTVVLHELIHGLGFVNSFDIADNPSQGTFGFEFQGDLTPLLFDIFVREGADSFLVDDFDNPSEGLLAAMTGDNLFFGGAEATTANGGTSPQLFAPSEFQTGASISHWDEDAFPRGDPDALMTPFVEAGEGNHDPGPNTFGLLRDLGYANAMRVLSLAIPQFGDGAGLTSDIVVVNLSQSQRVQGNVTFFDADGNALVTENVVAGGGAFDLAPLGSRTFATLGMAPGLTAGSAVVESNRSVSAVIRFDLTGTGVVGVGSALSLSKAIAPVRRQGDLRTGVAFRNTSPSEITVNLTLKNEEGVTVANGTAVRNLAVNARLAQFIDEIFPMADTANFRGTLCLETATGTFAAVALELEPGRVFTALPVAAPEN